LIAVDGLRQKLIKSARNLRTLFAVLGFNVDGYTDAQIVDAVIGAAPEIHQDWPTDDEMQRAFERLAAI
jgi:hypothetical protein